MEPPVCLALKVLGGLMAILGLPVLLAFLALSGCPVPRERRGPPEPLPPVLPQQHSFARQSASPSPPR